MKEKIQKNNKISAGIKLKNMFIKAWNKETWKKILTGAVAFATVITLASGCDDKNNDNKKLENSSESTEEINNVTTASEIFETFATTAQTAESSTTEQTTESTTATIVEQRPTVDNPWKRESLLIEDKLARSEYSFTPTCLTVPSGAKNGWSDEEEHQAYLNNENEFLSEMLYYYEYMWATKTPEMEIPLIFKNENQLNFAKTVVSSFEFRHLGVNYYPESYSKFTFYRSNKVIENEDGSYSIKMKLFDDSLFNEYVNSETVFEEYELAKAKAQQMVNEVSKTVSNDATEEEMAKALLDALAENTEYYNINRPIEGYGYSDYATAYTSLVNGMAICSGYTASYALLLKLAGINTIAIESDNHIWNLVFVDGNVKWTDVTFYDQETRKASEYIFQVPEEGGFYNSEDHAQSQSAKGYNTLTYQAYLKRIADSMEKEKSKLNDEGKSK